jgi:hypothetical protein
VTTVDELRQERVGTIRGTTLAQAVADAKVPPRNMDDSIAPTAFGDALRSGRVTAIVDGVEDALLPPPGTGSSSSTSEGVPPRC